jgi:hypothetical protein
LVEESEVVEVELRQSVGAGERVRPWVKLEVCVPREAEAEAEAEGVRVSMVGEVRGEREAVEVKVWEKVAQGVGEVEGVACTVGDTVEVEEAEKVTVTVEVELKVAVGEPVRVRVKVPKGEGVTVGEMVTRALVLDTEVVMVEEGEKELRVGEGGSVREGLAVEEAVRVGEVVAVKEAVELGQEEEVEEGVEAEVREGEEVVVMEGCPGEGEELGEGE